MLKKTIKYEDYSGKEREEDFYFNLTKAECMEMELATEGGMETRIQRIINSNDQKEIVKIFKGIILKAYGEKSDDGKRFVKISDEGYPLSRRFEQTEAYSNLFMLLSTNADEASKFINAVVPKDISEKAAEISAKQNNITAMPISNN